MRRLAKVLICMLYAAVLAAFYLYGRFDWAPPGGRDFWYGSGRAAWLLVLASVVVGFAVARWYAIGLALAPVLAAIPLQAQGKVGDFHDSYPPLENPFLWVLIVPGAALLLAIGVALGKRSERVTRRRQRAARGEPTWPVGRRRWN
jgi:hypothetical protein